MITKEHIEKYLSTHPQLKEERALRIVEDIKSLILGHGTDCPGITEAARQKWAHSDFTIDIAGVDKKLNKLSYYKDGKWDETHRALMISALLKTDPAQKWGIENAEYFEQAPHLEIISDTEKVSFTEAFRKVFGSAVEDEISSEKKQFNEIYRKISRRVEEAEGGNKFSNEEAKYFARMIEEIPKRSKREILMKKLSGLIS